MDNNTSANNQPATYSKKSCLIVASIIILFCITAITIGIVSYYKPYEKTAPSVDVEQTLSSLNINIQCNDNYKYVIVRINFYDANNNQFKSCTVREDNLKYKELKQIEYKLSTEELLKINRISYNVEEFK